MKKFLSAFILSLCPLLASAFEYIRDGVIYNLEYKYSRHIATVKGLSSTKTHLYIPSKVWYYDSTIGSQEYTVIEIASYAFSGDKYLRFIDIPGNIEIGSNSFAKCSALSEVKIATGITSIGYGAFDGCTELSTITLPNSLIFISGRLFTYSI